MTDGEEIRWIEVGRLGRPHGLRGELRLFLHNPESENIARFSRCRIVTDELDRETRIIGIRAGGGAMIASLDGVRDRTAAEPWTNGVVSVPESVFPAVDEPGTWYAYQLEGATAVDASGERIGVVSGVVDFGAGDLLAIDTGTDTLYVPFADPYVGDVDLEAGRVVVDPSDLVE